MNEIVITGSTGVIGRRAVRELLAAGHRVTGVTRSARGRERLESLGARAVEADVFDEASLRRAFDGADAVVNLLTHIPSADRMADPSAWEENDRLRTEASAAIARAAQAAGVQRLVQESIAFVYADGGDAWLDEDAPVAGGGVTTTALTAERNARELFDGDTVVLRFGLFIGPDSGSDAGRAGGRARRRLDRGRTARRVPADALARRRGGGHRRGAARPGRDVQRRRRRPADERRDRCRAGRRRRRRRPCARGRRRTGRWRARSACRAAGCARRAAGRRACARAPRAWGRIAA